MILCQDRFKRLVPLQWSHGSRFGRVSESRLALICIPLTQLPLISQFQVQPCVLGFERLCASRLGGASRWNPCSGGDADWALGLVKASGCALPSDDGC